MKVFPIYPWHEAAGKEIGSLYWAAQQDDDFPQDAEVVAIIASHDPHAETLRLLEDAADQIESGEQDTFGLTAYQANLCQEIRAHLAAMKGTK